MSNGNLGMQYPPPASPYQDLSMYYNPPASYAQSPGQMQPGGWYQGFTNLAGGGVGGGGGVGVGNAFNMAATGAGTGFGIGGPVGAAIGGGLGLLGGIFGGMAKGSKEKKTKKEYAAAQKAYQAKASQLFPEVGREAFQYQNPELNAAIQASLLHRMQNMYGDWGMPEGRTGGLESLNQFYNMAMPGAAPQLPSGVAPPSRQLPAGNSRRRSQGPGKGGWREDFRRNRQA